MSGKPEKPVCVLPSMITGSVIAGNGDAGAIVWGPGPGMANAMTPSAPDAAFASRIACRSEPGPLSLVFVTVKLEAALPAMSVSPVGEYDAVKSWPLPLMAAKVPVRELNCSNSNCCPTVGRKPG